MLGDNVVTRAVADMNTRLASLDADAIARLEETATLDPGDWLTLGDMASRAMIMGQIDADTAQTLHMIHTEFNRGATLAQRLVFLQVATELLAARVR